MKGTGYQVPRTNPHVSYIMRPLSRVNSPCHPAPFIVFHPKQVCHHAISPGMSCHLFHHITMIFVNHYYLPPITTPNMKLRTETMGFFVSGFCPRRVTRMDGSRILLKTHRNFSMNNAHYFISFSMTMSLLVFIISPYISHSEVCPVLRCSTILFVYYFSPTFAICSVR